eukprot:3420385-Amphidinium_carterae.1
MWRSAAETVEYTPTEQADSPAEEPAASSDVDPASPSLVLHAKSNRYHKKDPSRSARLMCGRPTVSG